jgi:hypothetical protein
MMSRCGEGRGGDKPSRRIRFHLATLLVGSITSAVVLYGSCRGHPSDLPYAYRDIWDAPYISESAKIEETMLAGVFDLNRYGWPFVCYEEGLRFNQKTSEIFSVNLVLNLLVGAAIVLAVSSFFEVAYRRYSWFGSDSNQGAADHRPAPPSPPSPPPAPKG